MTTTWKRYPPIERASPTLAVLGGPDGVWASGFGGVAWFSRADGWTPLTAGLPLGPVAALAFGGGLLLAGGAGGIARSPDRGRSWQPCSVPGGTGPVAAIALSPGFSHDGTALAATLDDGILRSTDAGRSWQPSSFGLPSREVLAVAWERGETAVAATAAGLARSPNAGRAWKTLAPTAGIAFVALATPADGSVLAAPEVGPLLRSTDDLTRWSTVGVESDEARTSALASLPGGGTLLRSAEHGIMRSTDGGETWSAVSTARALGFATDESRVYACTSTGVQESADDGQTWMDLPSAPLHDLRRLLFVDGVALICGSNFSPVRWGPDGEWTPLASAPLPLSGLSAAPDGTLFAAGPDGLFRSGDTGASWESVVEGREGCVTQMTFLPAGAGWAGVAPDSALLRTRDGGRTWERLPSPFGVLPLVALQAIPASQGRASASLMAATYDDRQHAVGTWRSDDGGERWTRGGETSTAWPVVTIGGSPPLMTIGNVIATQQPDGIWRKAAVGEAGLRRVVSDGATLIALAVDGVWRSEDLGTTWERDDAGLPVEQIMDVAVDSGVLSVLLSGGRLWSRPLLAAGAVNRYDPPRTRRA